VAQAKEKLINELAIARQKQNKLLDTYLAELIPEDVYKAKTELLNKEIVSVENEIKKLETNVEGDELTLEPIKKFFLKGISARKRYIDGPDEQKRIIVSELLWNLSISNQKVQDLQFKSAYAMVAKNPKPSNLGEMLISTLPVERFLRKIREFEGVVYPFIQVVTSSSRSDYPPSLKSPDYHWLCYVAAIQNPMPTSLRSGLSASAPFISPRPSLLSVFCRGSLVGVKQ
jgi:hypothetical protein